MNTHGTIAVLLVFLLLGIPVFGQAQSKDQLRKVDLQNSCSPAVQESFQRSVAMLHSFRYAETEKAFREVLAQDPSCAIATWGIAAILSRTRSPASDPRRNGLSARGRRSTRAASSARRPSASAITSRPSPRATR